MVRSTRSVCLMVTPSYSADCANVEHACHESYARTAALAHWRHMSTLKRHRMIESAVGVEPVPRVCLGGTLFVDPSADALSPDEARYLGTRELYYKFEGKLDGRHNNVGWTLALMEMLIDPMLKQWVPVWLVEQYERANPFFRESLTALVDVVRSNTELLRSTKREMIRRQRLHEQRKEARENVTSEAESDGDDDGAGNESDPDEEADQLAARLVNGAADDDDPNSARV